MAIRSKETLKRYFGKGMFPTAEQFGDLIDSFRQSGERLAMTDVGGLAEALNGKGDAKELKAVRQGLETLARTGLTMDKGTYDSLMRLLGTEPVHRFAQVVYEDEGLGADELKCRDGDIVLCIDRNGMRPSKVKVAIAVGTATDVVFYELPAEEDDDNMLFFQYYTGDELKWRKSDRRWILRPGSLFTGTMDPGGVPRLYVVNPDGMPERLIEEGDILPLWEGLGNLHYLEEEFEGRVSSLEESRVTPQTSYAGTPRNYIYSEPGNESPRAVITAKNTKFRQGSGKLQLQLGEWCGDRDSGRWWSRDVPGATTQHDGAMSRDVFNRLNTANIRESAASSTTVTISYPNYANGGTPFTFTLNPATSARAGVMTVPDKIKLSNAGVYAVEGASRKAVNGIFSLTTASTDAEIKAALTEYETKNVLKLSDLQYCAKYGCMLYDQQTRGFVQVANSGGGNFFNFIELSSLDFRYMPCIRFVCIKAEADGTFKVTRAAMEERICYKSELDALAGRVDALEAQQTANQ